MKCGIWLHDGPCKCANGKNQKMIAALFISDDGPYANRKDIDAWTELRDARKYTGPWKVIAHPPCERWGRYWSGGPNPKARRRKKGDDNGCFKSALGAVRRWGGVLEHPAYSHAWEWFDLKRPNIGGGWSSSDGREWVCHIEQGHYGHPSRKATWLFFVGKKPIDLIWGPAKKGLRLDEGFHSKEHRRVARANGQKPIKRLNEAERIHSPLKFVSALMALVKEAQSPAKHVRNEDEK